MQILAFQCRVDRWMLSTFGKEILLDRKERLHRFMEEALELVQSLGYTKEEVHTMADYVFGRPLGKPEQEIGGTLHCLSALCSAEDISLVACARDILLYCEERSNAIRQKHSQKPNSIVSNKNYSNGEEKNTLP